MIRTASLRDVDEIAGLRERLYGPLSKEAFKSYITTNPDLVLVAQEEEEVVGYSIGYLWKVGVGGISEIAVYEPHKEREVCGQLLDGTIKSLGKRGCTEARILVQKGLTDLFNLAMERGFEVKETTLVYEKHDFSVPSKGNQDVEIRAFKPSDLDEVLEIDRICFREFWQEGREEFLSVSGAQNHSFYVAVKDWRVVGYNYNRILPNRVGHYVRVAVHPTHQRMGIGSRLTANAVKYFEGVGVVKIFLRTLLDDFPAHKMYEKFGFKVVGNEYVLAMKI